VCAPLEYPPKNDRYLVLLLLLLHLHQHVFICSIIRNERVPLFPVVENSMIDGMECGGETSRSPYPRVVQQQDNNLDNNWGWKITYHHGGLQYWTYGYSTSPSHSGHNITTKPSNPWPPLYSTGSTYWMLAMVTGSSSVVMFVLNIIGKVSTGMTDMMIQGYTPTYHSTDHVRH